MKKYGLKKVYKWVNETQRWVYQTEDEKVVFMVPLGMDGWLEEGIEHLVKTGKIPEDFVRCWDIRTAVLVYSELAARMYCKGSDVLTGIKRDWRKKKKGGLDLIRFVDLCDDIIGIIGICRAKKGV